MPQLQNFARRPLPSGLPCGRRGRRPWKLFPSPREAATGGGDQISGEWGENQLRAFACAAAGYDLRCLPGGQLMPHPPKTEAPGREWEGAWSSPRLGRA